MLPVDDSISLVKHYLPALIVMAIYVAAASNPVIGAFRRIGWVLVTTFVAHFVVTRAGVTHAYLATFLPGSLPTSWRGLPVPHVIALAAGAIALFETADSWSEARMLKRHKGQDFAREVVEKQGKAVAGLAITILFWVCSANWTSMLFLCLALLAVLPAALESCGMPDHIQRVYHCVHSQVKCNSRRSE